MLKECGLSETECHSEGNALLEQLKEIKQGKWELRVWNNIWWCYTVYNRYLTISVDCHYERDTGKRQYSAMLSTDYSIGSEPIWWWNSNMHYDDPVTAVKEKIKLFQTGLKELTDLNETFKLIMGEEK